MHGVVADGEWLPHGRRLLVGERPGVALVDIHRNGEDLTGGPRGRDGDVGAGLLHGPRRLPEDHVTATGLGKHKHRPCLPASVEHQIDRCAPPHTRPHHDALDDVGIGRPALGGVAVQLRGARP